VARVTTGTRIVRVARLVDGQIFESFERYGRLKLRTPDNLLASRIYTRDRGGGGDGGALSRFPFHFTRAAAPVERARVPVVAEDRRVGNTVSRHKRAVRFRGKQIVVSLPYQSRVRQIFSPRINVYDGR